MTKPRFQYTPDYIDKTVLTEKHEVFVYGDNTQSRHGKGAAVTALTDFGAIHGVYGYCGRSYGIITTDLRVKTPYSVEHKQHMLAFIKSQVHSLYKFAHFRPDLHFYCTLLGTGLAGFYTVDIAPIFKLWPKPVNVVLPKEFSNTY